MAYQLRQVIQEKLDAHKMNSSDLERKAGLSASSVRKILLGISQNPTLETLKAIATVFNCTLDDLVGRRVVTEQDTNQNYIKKNLTLNPELIIAIIQETIAHDDKTNNQMDFDSFIKFISETYQYCLIKKHGQFDKDFLHWYFTQQFLEDK